MREARSVSGGSRILDSLAGNLTAHMSISGGTRVPQESKVEAPLPAGGIQNSLKRGRERGIEHLVQTSITSNIAGEKKWQLCPNQDFLWLPYVDITTFPEKISGGARRFQNT